MTDRIEQIALEVAREMPMHPWGIMSTRETYLEAIHRCLAKIGEGLEPVYLKWNYYEGAWESVTKEDFDSIKSDEGRWELYATPAEVILAAENTVDEAITNLIRAVESDWDKSGNFAKSNAAEYLRTAIRTGKWREYK